MDERRALLAERVSLVDALDTLLNKGVVLSGEALLSVAGVDLVYVGLNLLVASVETLRRSVDGVEDSARPLGSLPGGREHLDHPLAESGSLSLQRGVHATGLSTPPPPLYAAPQTRGPVSTSPDPATSASAVVPPAGALDLTGDRPEQGLAQLVLTLIELLRQLLERQALRRMEGGSLSDETVERMGSALMELEAKMAELRDAFGLGPEDLNIDLGPLGRLV